MTLDDLQRCPKCGTWQHDLKPCPKCGSWVANKRLIKNGPSHRIPCGCILECPECGTIKAVGVNYESIYSLRCVKCGRIDYRNKWILVQRND